MLRLLRLALHLHCIKLALAGQVSYTAVQLAMSELGPLRGAIYSSCAIQVLALGCSFVLPFHLQLAFHLMLALLVTSLHAPSAAQVLSGAPWAPAIPPSCAVPTLLPTTTCLGPLTSPPLALNLYQQARSLCTTLDSIKRGILSIDAPLTSCTLPDPCQVAPAAILVTFVTLYLGLFLPVLLAYRLEHHAKSMYVRDVRARQQQHVSHRSSSSLSAIEAAPDLDNLRRPPAASLSTGSSASVIEAAPALVSLLDTAASAPPEPAGCCSMQQDVSGGSSMRQDVSHRSMQQSGSHCSSLQLDGSHSSSMQQDGSHRSSMQQDGSHSSSMQQDGSHRSMQQDGSHSSSMQQEGWEAAMDDMLSYTLPHWTDLGIVALLGLLAWEAAVGLQGHTAYLPV